MCPNEGCWAVWPNLEQFSTTLQKLYKDIFWNWQLAFNDCKDMFDRNISRSIPLENLIQLSLESKQFSFYQSLIRNNVP